MYHLGYGSNADRKIGQIDTKVAENGPKLDRKFQIGLAWKTESFLEHFLNRYFGQVVVTLQENSECISSLETCCKCSYNTIVDQVWDIGIFYGLI